MKFPKKLSKERLSLLSPEDRKIYEYEHSGLCPEMKKLQESRKKIVKNDKGEIVPDTCTKCGAKIGSDEKVHASSVEENSSISHKFF